MSQGGPYGLRVQGVGRPPEWDHRGRRENSFYSVLVSYGICRDAVVVGRAVQRRGPCARVRHVVGDAWLPPAGPADDAAVRTYRLLSDPLRRQRFGALAERRHRHVAAGLSEHVPVAEDPMVDADRPDDVERGGRRGGSGVRAGPGAGREPSRRRTRSECTGTAPDRVLRSSGCGRGTATCRAAAGAPCGCERPALAREPPGRTAASLTTSAA